MMKSKLLISIVFCLIIFSQSNIVYGQNVGIGTTNPDPSAMLDVNSTSKGFLVPRMSTADRNAITSPVNGLLVYDTDTNTFWFHVNSGWIELKSDNLGDHTATQNVQLNGNWLSGDGDDEGVFVSTEGGVGIGTSFLSNEALHISDFPGTTAGVYITTNTDIGSSNIAELNFASNYGSSPNFAVIGQKDDGSLRLTGSWDLSSPDMVITDGGNVGIGTVAPDEKLHVAGNMHLTGTFKDQDGDAGTSGQILSSTATGTDWIAAPGGGDFSNGGEAGGSDRTLGNTDNYGLGFKTNNITRLHIQNNGDVGIGITNPAAQLAVAYSARFQDNTTGFADTDGLSVGIDGAENAFLFNQENTILKIGTNNAIQMYFNTDGKIGIGTNTPTQKLEVSGKLKVGNDVNAPSVGTIRWNSTTNDFEGYTGTEWLSLTGHTQWGKMETNPNHENSKIIANDGTLYDEFGNSVSISEDYAIIGAAYDDISGNNSQGSAYIFHRSGTNWTQQEKLTADDGYAYDLFGNSVSISGDYAIIGAAYDDISGTGNTDQGSAYIFHRDSTTWSQQAKLIASDGDGGDEFGNSVSISGDYAIIGASYDDISGNNSQGSAYIFHRDSTTWSQQAKLIASDGDAFNYFGISVSISGDYAIIGAYGDDSNQGSAYIFHRDSTTWSQQAKLTASDGDGGDEFGNSVSIDGDYAIIGAHDDEISGTGNTNQGSAYIFHRSGTNWTQQAKLTASDGDVNDEFGNSVFISGDYAIIGAEMDDLSGTIDQGSAYIFHRDGTNWIQQAKLTASHGDVNDEFGYSVSISGDYAIIGVEGDDVSGNTNQGSAYIFNK